LFENKVPARKFKYTKVDREFAPSKKNGFSDNAEFATEHDEAVAAFDDMEKPVAVHKEHA